MKAFFLCIVFGLVLLPSAGMFANEPPGRSIESIHALSPREGRVVKVDPNDKAERQAWERAARWYHSLPVAETPAHPGAASFPGAVPDSADRVSASVRIGPNMPRWQSTGLYAAPGESVVVKVPREMAERGWKIRVGCHSDAIWRRNAWRRFPIISRVFDVTTSEVTVANAFGGLIYIDIPRDKARGGHHVPTFGGYGWIGETPGNEPAVEVTITGAVRAPEFVLGRDDPAMWADTLAATGAPWGEIAGKHLILSLPRASLEKIADPSALAAFWDEALDACWEFAGWPGARLVPERFVFDLQISAGLLHSGYPIMAHLPQADEATNVEALREKGSWGFFHELGHNHQGRAYTFDSFTEVTVNLHTLYLMSQLCGLTPRDRFSDIDKILQERLEGGQTAPRHHLAMYVLLIEAFGYESLTRTFQTYLSDEGRKGLLGSGSQGARVDAWVRRYSQAVGRNLCAYFDLFDLRASAETRQILAGLEPWMPGDGFIAKHAARMADATENCDAMAP